VKHLGMCAGYGGVGREAPHRETVVYKLRPHDHWCGNCRTRAGGEADQSSVDAAPYNHPYLPRKDG